jgi:S1-C subfamily serine protease
MNNRNQITSLALVAAAATLFGMVLAGGMQVTPSTAADPGSPRVVPVAAPADTQLPVLSFADIAEKVTPAVVGIRATGHGARSTFSSGTTPPGTASTLPAVRIAAIAVVRGS